MVGMVDCVVNVNWTLKRYFLQHLSCHFLNWFN